MSLMAHRPVSISDTICNGLILSVGKSLNYSKNLSQKTDIRADFQHKFQVVSYLHSEIENFDYEKVNGNGVPD